MGSLRDCPHCGARQSIAFTDRRPFSNCSNCSRTYALGRRPGALK
ncbi:MAG TPA: hypothetical protein VEJ18_11890 [Planctomycetota bacterium]|nr:hypothetical protein [Planctomycetota bacterium]